MREAVVIEYRSLVNEGYVGSTSYVINGEWKEEWYIPFAYRLGCWDVEQIRRQLFVLCLSWLIYLALCLRCLASLRVGIGFQGG
ncbi:hypothetical protein BDV23DRAFT_149531 [Aspergillus alliaceus]|uniref:Uncharacterized protein n=1 Tax=Petromyces alliaceus TaxID=209559 RepID=A0A5N7CGQ6_PETAA|nr:hypothetical protein BDV23DRAFT_149531 [Aspergillus alliaceus]